MKTNRFRARCAGCAGPVAPRAGVLRGRRGAWRVYHLACDDAEPGVVVIETSGGTFIQNRAGRCEDAPCCGCCTI